MKFFIAAASLLYLSTSAQAFITSARRDKAYLLSAYDDYVESLKRANSESVKTEGRPDFSAFYKRESDVENNISPPEAFETKATDAGWRTDDSEFANFVEKFNDPTLPKSSRTATTRDFSDAVFEPRRMSKPRDFGQQSRFEVKPPPAPTYDTISKASTTQVFKNAAGQEWRTDDSDFANFVRRFNTPIEYPVEESPIELPTDDFSEALFESQEEMTIPIEFEQSTFERKPQPKPTFDTKGMTERIMRRLPAEQQAWGAGGMSSWEAFQRAEANWRKLRQFKPLDSKNPGKKKIEPPPQFVSQDVGIGNPACWAKLRARNQLDFDVVVCGGTLGIFYAMALQLKGLKVLVVEAGPLRGREQEWNISLDELLELVKIGVLTPDDIDAAVRTEFAGCRSGFKNMEVTPLSKGYFENKIGFECFTPDVLNLGISPAILIERVAWRFVEIGGTICEKTRILGIAISEVVGAAIDLENDFEPVTAKLVIDCMGNASPISRQQRWGVKPDGICAVVGTCAAGYDPRTNLNGDIIYTFTTIQDVGESKNQYFWESFPVGIGRNGLAPGTSDIKTTYMFTYMDADEQRPSLESLMEDYWRLLPIYQPSISNPETDLDIKRVLFAFFPTYRDSPLKPQWSRILPVGDASGIQSPLSFGGFGALTRHLGRISNAVDEAVRDNLLDKEYLGAINAYTPNLSAAWMFQKAMSVKVGQKVNPEFVNRLLAVNFEIMDDMGQRTIKPFLQDVIRFDGLFGSLTRAFLTDPLFMPAIIAHVGLPQLMDWLGHVRMIWYYDFLHKFVAPVMGSIAERNNDPAERFLWRRRLEAWKYGSGNDYKLPKRN